MRLFQSLVLLLGLVSLATAQINWGEVGVIAGSLSIPVIAYYRGQLFMASAVEEALMPFNSSILDSPYNSSNPAAISVLPPPTADLMPLPPSCSAKSAVEHLPTLSCPADEFGNSSLLSGPMMSLIQSILEPEIESTWPEYSVDVVGWLFQYTRLWANEIYSDASKLFVFAVGALGISIATAWALIAFLLVIKIHCVRHGVRLRDLIISPCQSIYDWFTDFAKPLSWAIITYLFQSTILWCRSTVWPLAQGFEECIASKVGRLVNLSACICKPYIVRALRAVPDCAGATFDLLIFFTLVVTAAALASLVIVTAATFTFVIIIIACIFTIYFGLYHIAKKLASNFSARCKLLWLGITTVAEGIARATVEVLSVTFRGTVLVFASLFYGIRIASQMDPLMWQDVHNWRNESTAIRVEQAEHTRQLEESSRKQLELTNSIQAFLIRLVASEATQEELRQYKDIFQHIVHTGAADNVRRLATGNHPGQHGPLFWRLDMHPELSVKELQSRRCRQLRGDPNYALEADYFDKNEELLALNMRDNDFEQRLRLLEDREPVSQVSIPQVDEATARILKKLEAALIRAYEKIHALEAKTTRMQAAALFGPKEKIADTRPAVIPPVAPSSMVLRQEAVEAIEKEPLIKDSGAAPAVAPPSAPVKKYDVVPRRKVPQSASIPLPPSPTIEAKIKSPKTGKASPIGKIAGARRPARKSSPTRSSSATKTSAASTQPAHDSKVTAVIPSVLEKKAAGTAVKYLQVKSSVNTPSAPAFNWSSAGKAASTTSAASSSSMPAEKTSNVVVQPATTSKPAPVEKPVDKSKLLAAKTAARRPTPGVEAESSAAVQPVQKKPLPMPKTLAVQERSPLMDEADALRANSSINISMDESLCHLGSKKHYYGDLIDERAQGHLAQFKRQFPGDYFMKLEVAAQGHACGLRALYISWHRQFSHVQNYDKVTFEHIVDAAFLSMEQWQKFETNYSSHELEYIMNIALFIAANEDFDTELCTFNVVLGGFIEGGDRVIIWDEGNKLDKGQAKGVLWLHNDSAEGLSNGKVSVVNHWTGLAPYDPTQAAKESQTMAKVTALDSSASQAEEAPPETDASSSKSAPRIKSVPPAKDVADECAELGWNRSVALCGEGSGVISIYGDHATDLDYMKQFKRAFPGREYTKISVSDDSRLSGVRAVYASWKHQFKWYEYCESLMFDHLLETALDRYAEIETGGTFSVHDLQHIINESLLRFPEWDDYIVIGVWRDEFGPFIDDFSNVEDGSPVLWIGEHNEIDLLKTKFTRYIGLGPVVTDLPKVTASLPAAIATSMDTQSPSNETDQKGVGTKSESEPKSAVKPANTASTAAAGPGKKAAAILLESAVKGSCMTQSDWAPGSDGKKEEKTVTFAEKLTFTSPVKPTTTVADSALPQETAPASIFGISLPNGIDTSIFDLDNKAYGWINFADSSAAFPGFSSVPEPSPTQPARGQQIVPVQAPFFNAPPAQTACAPVFGNPQIAASAPVNVDMDMTGVRDPGFGSLNQPNTIAPTMYNNVEMLDIPGEMEQPVAAPPAMFTAPTQPTIAEVDMPDIRQAKPSKTASGSDRDLSKCSGDTFEPAVVKTTTEEVVMGGFSSQGGTGWDLNAPPRLTPSKDPINDTQGGSAWNFKPIKLQYSSNGPMGDSQWARKSSEDPIDETSAKHVDVSNAASTAKSTTSTTAAIIPFGGAKVKKSAFGRAETETEKQDAVGKDILDAFGPDFSMGGVPLFQNAQKSLLPLQKKGNKQEGESINAVWKRENAKKEAANNDAAATAAAAAAIGKEKQRTVLIPTSPTKKNDAPPRVPVFGTAPNPPPPQEPGKVEDQAALDTCLTASLRAMANVQKQGKSDDSYPSHPKVQQQLSEFTGGFLPPPPPKRKAGPSKVESVPESPGKPRRFAKPKSKLGARGAGAASSGTDYATGAAFASVFTGFGAGGATAVASAGVIGAAIAAAKQAEKKVEKAEEKNDTQKSILAEAAGYKLPKKISFVADNSDSPDTDAESKSGSESDYDSKGSYEDGFGPKLPDSDESDESVDTEDDDLATIRQQVVDEDLAHVRHLEELRRKANQRPPPTKKEKPRKIAQPGKMWQTMSDVKKISDEKNHEFLEWLEASDPDEKVEVELVRGGFDSDKVGEDLETVEEDVQGGREVEEEEGEEEDQGVYQYTYITGYEYANAEDGVLDNEVIGNKECLGQKLGSGDGRVSR